MNKSLRKDNDAIRMKRLAYRSAHRGNKEMDLLLAWFAERKLPELQGHALDTYEKLLDEEDAAIWDWVLAKEDVPEAYRPLIEALRALTPGGA